MTTTQSAYAMGTRFFLLLALSSLVVEGYSLVFTPTFQTRRTELSMKRGRGSFKKEIGSSSSSPSSNSKVGAGMASSMAGGSTSKSINWCPMPANQKLPTEPGKVGLLDTNLPTLKKQATNPTGAVGVVTYQAETYCFSASCPSCQVPLTKAKVVSSSSSDGGAAASPKLVCDFCKATYNLKDGSKSESADNGGLFGGVVKSIFATQES
eukprot:CAMPEP_0168740972 /NCGR_PEP_ID=MMETSP0724-20121128/12262_1 /TAXON_ID=265536 /ORGANISM="Amphiprora sp., Strain CCMP467" /LENGTH=208 /DNA_ID=CAMNT_0008788439 /DNA_START=94 /DNA_END=717 /DNA_ORIENTATION=+